MNFKGTPGPWIVVDNVQLPIDGAKSSAKYIGTYNIKTEPCEKYEIGLWLAAVQPYECTGFTSKEQAEANAKLIACAPELLEVLQEALKPLKDYYAYPPLIEKIEAVINKATT